MRAIALIILLVTLSACLGPKTPQEVTQAFWESVIDNDVDDIVEYSTLISAKEYDHFSKDWQAYHPTWGRVVIEANKASVVTRFSKAAATEDQNREFTTHLVRRNGQWLIDYSRTNEEVQGGVIANLFGKIGEVGKELSQQLNAAAGEVEAEMERMGNELEELSGSLDKQASEKLEKFAQQLRENIKELEESVKRALKEKDKQLSDHDRRILKEVATDLEKDSENLSDPSVQSIADGSKHVGKLQRRLELINASSVVNYKKQWRKWGEKFEADVKRILETLSAQAEGPG